MNFKLLEEKAKLAGIKEIELYTKEDNKISFNVFDNEINKKTIAKTKVFCIRGVYNNKLATIYTENDSDDNVDNIISNLKNNANNLTNRDPYFIYGGDKDYQKVTNEELKVKNISIPDKINYLLNLTKKLKEIAPLYYHADADYVEVTGSVSIINNNGLNVKKEYEYAEIAASLILKKDEQTAFGYKYKFIKDLNDFDFNLLNELSKEVESKLGAKSISSNSYEIILKNNVIADLMNAFIDNFYANNVKRKLSFLDDAIDKQVFGNNINLVDDPFYKDAPIKDTFDDEGVATSKHQVVKDGKLLTYLHNLSTASYYNLKSTGNGFKASPSSPVSINTTTFCLEPGNISLDEIIKNTKEAIMITDVTGLHAGVNAISGDFNLQCSGYYIKNGKIERALTLMVLSGNFKDMLNNVKEIASDIEYNNGMAMPSLVINNMNISGN